LAQLLKQIAARRDQRMTAKIETIMDIIASAAIRAAIILALCCKRSSCPEPR
jgi:hypothetical protein